MGKMLQLEVDHTVEVLKKELKDIEKPFLGYLEKHLSFLGHSVRVYRDGDEIWFCAKDVCEILGITDSRQAVQRLREYDKRLLKVDPKVGISGSCNTPDVVPVPRQVQGDEEKNRDNQARNMSFISELGLYKLIFTSRNPEAEAFQDWICREVLPQLRRHGSYMLPQKRQELENFRREYLRQKFEACIYWIQLRTKDDISRIMFIRLILEHQFRFAYGADFPENLPLELGKNPLQVFDSLSLPLQALVAVGMSLVVSSTPFINRKSRFTVESGEKFLLDFIPILRGFTEFSRGLGHPSLNLLT